MTLVYGANLDLLRTAASSDAADIRVCATSHVRALGPLLWSLRPRWYRMLRRPNRVHAVPDLAAKAKPNPPLAPARQGLHGPGMQADNSGVTLDKPEGNGK